MIHSRFGRAVLGIIGALYFIASTTLLVYYLATNWNANGLMDYALQLALLGAAVGGILIFLIGADISISRARPAGRAATNHHKAAAAAS